MGTELHIRREQHLTLGDLAQQQGGCVAAWQAQLLGLGPERLRRRAQREGWRCPFRSVYILPGVPVTTTTRLWAGLLSVAVISEAELAHTLRPRSPGEVRDIVGSSVAVTGWSAAWEYGFRSWRTPSPQLLADHSTISRRRGLRLIRSRLPIEGMWQWRSGLPLATPARTLWDCAHLLRGHPTGGSRVADLAVFFDRTRTMSIDELVLLADEPVAMGLPRRPPDALRLAANTLRRGFSHSKTEGRARRVAVEVCERLGVKLEPRPFPVRLDGRIVAEVDLAVPGLRFGGEVDGPHHDAPSVTRYDARRDAILTRQLDWTIRRYPTSRLDKGDGLAWFERTFERDLIKVMGHSRAA